jgi:hypothetical protein
MPDDLTGAGRDNPSQNRAEGRRSYTGGITTSRRSGPLAAITHHNRAEGRRSYECMRRVSCAP